MKIIVDGREDLVSADDTDCLGDILTEITAFLQENGQSVIEIQLDDNIIDREKWVAFASELLGQFNELHITTVPTEELCLSTLKEMQDTLPKISAQIQQVAIEVQSGKTNTALDQLNSVLLSWEMVQLGLQNIGRLFKLDFSTIQTGEITLEELSKKGNQMLVETKDAMEAADMVTVSDILEYELAPLFKNWEVALETIVKEISK